MLKITNIKITGMDTAIRGMRNPRLSHHLSDSHMDMDGIYVIGPKDLALAKSLCRKGASDRKFLRMIHFTADIEGSISFWHDFDTYKVGTVTNSESRMQWLKDNEITAEKLGLDDWNCSEVRAYITYLNKLRETWKSETNARLKREYWNDLVRALPAGYRQLRTVDLNYETLFAIYRDRRDHPLYEFRELCANITTLPYAREFIVDPINKEDNDAS